ncbi:MAG: hypothetical protein OXG15_08540 [Gammaproteobacteria bacterium]|nr:hypothetical protein [Gammaproteobacteria bacterium]
MIPFDCQVRIGSPNLLSREDLTLVVLHLQSAGWNRANEVFAELSPMKNEEYLNGCLFQGMVDARNTFRLYNLFVVEKPSVRSVHARATSDKVPDLGVYFVGFSDNYPHALIECKRLDLSDVTRAPRREYVRNGMDRFVDGSYGREHELDFMVAYVIDGDITAAMTDINFYLANVGRVEESLHLETRFSGTGSVARSEHVRSATDSRCILLHSFLRLR